MSREVRLHCDSAIVPVYKMGDRKRFPGNQDLVHTHPREPMIMSQNEDVIDPHRDQLKERILPHQLNLFLHV